MNKLIKKILSETRQLLKESCTCYTANPVGGGAMLVYDLCGGSTQAASCSCCCQAWLHPTYVDQQNCLTTSVAPPDNDGGLGLYADEILTMDDLDTGSAGGYTKGSGFIERDNMKKDILIPKGGVKTIGGGSGFKNKQGSSDRLTKYNERQSMDINESDLKRIIKRVINEEGFVMKSGAVTPVGPGHIKPFSSADGISQRRKPKGKSQELNEEQWCGDDDTGGWCTDMQYCKCIGSNCGCEDMNMTGGGGKNKDGKLQNAGRGDSATDSLRLRERQEELNERMTCWHRTGTRSSGKHSCSRHGCGTGDWNIPGHRNEFGSRFDCMGSYGGGGGNDGTTKGGRTSTTTTTTGSGGNDMSAYDNNPISENSNHIEIKRLTDKILRGISRR